MDRHKCKLCSRSFFSGRALGGHMRSHLANLPIPPKTQLGDQLTESASSLCSSEDDLERESEEKSLVYVLRENPKKSFKMVDPEFLDAGSVVQDRESETESTRNPTRQRSKRTRKMKTGLAENQEPKKPKLIKSSSTESTHELEPVSSVSDTSSEEDVALCLMMLSRDSWSSDDSDELKLSQTQLKYQCETCKKVFRSFQALGGHRTSHKKIKNRFEGESNPPKKVYECPFCEKVFGSGQALGGHKRSHLLLGSSSTMGVSVNRKKCDKVRDCLIDLNLPAPMEDEDLSQLEVSAVFDQTLTLHS